MSMLYDKILRIMLQGKPSAEEGSIIRHMMDAQIFDATNVAGVLEHTIRSMNDVMSGVPARPPFLHTWIEWPQNIVADDGPILIQAINGLLITQITEDVIEKARVHLGDEVVDEALRDGTGQRLCCLSFLDVRYTSVASVPLGLCKDSLQNICLGPDWRELDTLNFAPIDEIFPHLPAATFYLPSENPVPVSVPAVPLYVLQLLNCKNIEHEIHRPPEKLQRATIKRKHPPLCTYKTLRLNLPGATLSTTAQGDGEGMRFHLVRGHFKNLQHDRFVSKGWHWWPAHARGNRQLGAVVKQYDVHQL
jgi:hypothetical protein